MAVKTQEEIIASLSAYIGEDTSEDGLHLFEDVMDTMKDLSDKNNVNEAEVAKRVQKVDEAWRKKYLSRFNAGIIGSANDDAAEMEEMVKTQKAEKITVADLFQPNERKV